MSPKKLTPLLQFFDRIFDRNEFETEQKQIN